VYISSLYEHTYMYLRAEIVQLHPKDIYGILTFNVGLVTLSS